MDELDTEIARWRAFVERDHAVDAPTVEELEDHLRGQISDLVVAGLSEDEAFLVAVKRMGKLDDLSQEFALEHSGRLWRQLVVAGHDEPQVDSRSTDMLVFAVAAAIAVQVVRLIAGLSDEEPWWILRNAGLFVLPFLAAYFARVRRLPLRRVVQVAVPIVAAAIVINLYPFADEAATQFLVAAHLPVFLWFVVAHPYTGGHLGMHQRRMDFVRFTGEWFIYYVLIALGGGVLMGLTAAIFEPTGIDIERLVEWVLPSGAAAAVIVAAWLVESKQKVIENMAPVLTMLFTPLFALMLAGATVVYVLTGFGGAFDRELLGIFDALLVVVLGLVLYGISARDPLAPPGWMDRIQLVAVVSALALDLIVLGAMILRIGEFGFTPNRTAALGLNIVLLMSLAGTAWLLTRFIRGSGAFIQLERWQTAYLPVFAIWTATVVVVLPPLFGFA